MRTPPNPVPRTRLVACLLAFAAAALLAPAPARAAGTLLVDHFAVEHCEELGTCEWKLACKIGDEAPQDLIPNGIGGDGEKLAIDKSLPVPRFPVNVSCTLWEDDGFLGTSYKEVATGSLAVPGGGDYAISLLAEGQGGGQVRLRADSLEIGNPPPKGDPRRFLGAFRSSDEGHAVLVGMDWQTLDARRAALAKQGVQPVMLETYTDGKQRLWTAIFRTAPEEHVIVPGLEWEPFRTRLEELEGQGKHLIDFETYVEGKKRLFAGIFRQGRDRTTLVVGQSPSAFQSQLNRLANQRLTDFEVYRSGRDLLYSGVFLPGTGSHGFRIGLEWAAFDARLKEGGARLADLETYEDGRKRFYDGVFRGSSGDVAVEQGADWATLEARWREHTARGLRLIDVETLAGIGSDD